MSTRAITRLEIVRDLANVPDSELDKIQERRSVGGFLSLMEIMYLAKKNRIDIGLAETLERIQRSDGYPDRHPG